jgi:hypothetical protein
MMLGMLKRHEIIAIQRMERTYPKGPALQLVRDEAAEVMAATVR